MQKIDYSKIIRILPNQRVERPNKAEAGTLSGHAAGEPFEKKIYQDLKKMYPKRIFKQFEFLNDIYLKHPNHITVADRYALIDSPTALFLLSRGDSATKKWSVTNLFEERQNDTADILYYIPGFYNVIDAKTRNLNKNAQPPNIISAYKLARMCAIMIDNEEYGTIGIDYIGVDWTEDKHSNTLVCHNAHHVDLFKVTPSLLYINWSAGLQIQFHLDRIDQSWEGSMKEWALAYLRHFVESARSRIDAIREDFIEPFLKYIN